MGDAACACKANIGLLRKVSPETFPDKMEGVIGGPHISATTSYQVGAAFQIKYDGAGLAALAHVPMRFEQA
jgi:hypothetical protein